MKLTQLLFFVFYCAGTCDFSVGRPPEPRCDSGPLRGLRHPVSLCFICCLTPARCAVSITSLYICSSPADDPDDIPFVPFLSFRLLSTYSAALVCDLCPPPLLCIAPPGGFIFPSSLWFVLFCHHFVLYCESLSLETMCFFTAPFIQHLTDL